MLSDSQLVRYSRHILLRGIGGVGQQKLLAIGADILSSGAAFDWIATYLAAAGCAVRGASPSLALADLNPDSSGTPSRWLPVFGAAARAAVGFCVSDDAIAFGSESGCSDCFAQFQRRAVAISDAHAAQVASWAALMFQRAALGALRDSCLLRINALDFSAEPLALCPACQSRATK